ncbi:MAG TPA: hypothetical protein VHB77_02040 [Planctomycetaceae bacterium]|nr:hypothetical protein [Planctomycetaceae bacterium]
MSSRWSEELPESLRFDLVTNLTLILFLLHAPDFWYARSPLAVLAICGLIYRPLRLRMEFWAATTAILALSLWLNWFAVDNHKYLEAYLSLALCCTFAATEADRGAVLASTARWLIGLCVGLSVVWKLMSPDFVNGAFFEFTLLVDDRFAHVASWFGGISLETLFQNREVEHMLTHGYVQGIALEDVTLKSSPQLKLLARCITGWTLAIESLLALAFLLPSRLRLAALRDPALLVFAATTYLVANVQGFGWLLMILGIAQCRRTRAAFLYVAVYLLIEVYNIPYGDMVSSVLSR